MAKFRQYQKIFIVPPVSGSRSWINSLVGSIQNQTLYTSPIPAWSVASRYRVALLPPAISLIPPARSTNNWTESVHQDALQRAYPDYIFRLKEERYLYPSEFRVDKPLPVTQEPWPDFGDQPDIIFRSKELRYTYPSTFQNPGLFNVPNIIQSDTNVPAKVKNQNYLYPSSFAPSTIPSEVVTLDKWYEETSRPINISKQAYLYQFLTWNPSTPSAPGPTPKVTGYKYMPQNLGRGRFMH